MQLLVLAAILPHSATGAARSLAVMTLVIAAIMLSVNKTSVLPWPSARDSAIIAHVFAALAMAGYLWEMPGMAIAFGIFTTTAVAIVVLCAGPEYMIERKTAPPRHYWWRCAALSAPLGVGLIAGLLFPVQEQDEE